MLACSTQVGEASLIRTVATTMVVLWLWLAVACLEMKAVLHLWLLGVMPPLPHIKLEITEKLAGYSLKRV
jgi:hypothetical protein